MKYIMFEQKVGDIVRKVPIIFPDFIVHSDMELWVREMFKIKYPSDVKIISAGSISVQVNSVYGKSTTLKLESDQDDLQIINLYDYFHGVVM